MATTSEVLSAAKGLTAQQRAEVVHELLLTLEPDECDDDVEQAWAIEIRRRLKAIRDGSITLRDWDDALWDIRGSIQSRGPA
jgi:hypothetical protein